MHCAAGGPSSHPTFHGDDFTARDFCDACAIASLVPISLRRVRKVREGVSHGPTARESLVPSTRDDGAEGV